FSPFKKFRQKTAGPNDLARGLSTSLGLTVTKRPSLLSQLEPVYDLQVARLSLSFLLRLCWVPTPRALCGLPSVALLLPYLHQTKLRLSLGGLRAQFRGSPFRAPGISSSADL